MNKIAEVAKAEADEAERETPDEPEEEEAAEGEPEPAPEPAPEPEPQAAAMTEQQAEREIAKLARLASTYLGKAYEIATKLGMPVEVCPLDAYPGLAIPRHAHEVTSDVEARVLALIGKSVEPEWIESDQYERCLACNGWGEVLTGAQKGISRTAPCNVCGGKGFKPVVQAYVPTPPATPAPFPGAAVPFVPLPTGTNDAWGRPAGHPHWGLDPAMVGSPNGQTVG
jgi:hypothetical protein